MTAQGSGKVGASLAPRLGRAVWAAVGAWWLGTGLALAAGPAPVTTVDFQAVEPSQQTADPGPRLALWAAWSFPRGRAFGTPWGVEAPVADGDDRIRSLRMQVDAAIGRDTRLGLAWQRGRQRSLTTQPPLEGRLDLEHEGWDLVGIRRLDWDAAEATWSVEAAVGRYRLTQAETWAGDTEAGRDRSVVWRLGLEAAWRIASPWELVAGVQWRHAKFDVSPTLGARPGLVGPDTAARRLDLGGPSVQLGLRWLMR